MIRGINRFGIFNDEEDYLRFLETIMKIINFRIRGDKLDITELYTSARTPSDTIYELSKKTLISSIIPKRA
jgi:hypothetical protein